MQETAVIPDNIEFESIQNCDLCGSQEFAYWDSARSNTLSCCKKCGLVFTNPRIADSNIKDKVLYYRETYFNQKSRMTKKLFDARKKTHQMESNFLKRFISKGKILDIGCGTGVFLDCFDVDWEKHGSDVSLFALDEARKRGIKVYHGEFEKIDFRNLRFDVVYFRASLHHTYSPRLCLKKAYELLKPNGIVAICMNNNHDGFAGKIFKAHVKSYEQAHNYLFSTSILKKYLSLIGFSIIGVSYPYWGTGYESYRDFLEIIPLYIKYLFLCLSSRVNKIGSYDFSSSAFYGNYINIYGRKQVKDE